MGDSDNFFYRGDTCQNLAPSILSQRRHSQVNGAFPDLLGARVGQDQLPNLVADYQQFINPGTSTVARFITMSASSPPEGTGRFWIIDSHVQKGAGFNRATLLAFRADDPDQPLRKNTQNSG